MSCESRGTNQPLKVTVFVISSRRLLCSSIGSAKCSLGFLEVLEEREEETVINSPEDMVIDSRDHDA